MSPLAPSQLKADPAIQNGQSIAFLGDSITQAGWSHPGGYVRLVVAGLAANDIKVTPIPAGISGHKSNQMLERLKRDVLDKKPDWMTLSCGVNDVWHGVRGVPLAQYKTNIAAIVDQCQAAGVKVMVLTATVIGEDLENENNRLLAAYNDYLRSLAREKRCLLADLNALFQEAIKASGKPGRLLTSDGVHMNAAGDQLMARGILKAFGLSDAALKKAQEAWQDLPGGALLRASYAAGKGKVFQGVCQVSLRQSRELETKAASRNQSLEDLLNETYAQEAKALLRPTGPYESFEEVFRRNQQREVQRLLDEKFAQRVKALLSP